MADPYECHRCGAGFPKLVPYCPACLTDGTVRPAQRRRQRGRAPTLTTAGQLSRAQHELVHVPALPGVRILPGALVLLHGDPGAGKSTLALQALDSIADGPLLAYLPEEGAGPSVTERLDRLGIRRDDLLILADADLDQFEQLARHCRARAALIDSVTVTTLQPEHARRLVQSLGWLALFGVLQVNKRGEIAGLRAWDHEADVRIDVQQGRWTVEKSRFQPQPYPAAPITSLHDSTSALP